MPAHRPDDPRNLELTKTFIGRERKGSLLWAMDRRKPPWGRVFSSSGWSVPCSTLMSCNGATTPSRSWCVRSSAPTRCEAASRHWWTSRRLVSRVVYGTATGRDLIALAASLSNITPLQEEASALKAPLLQDTVAGLDPLDDLRTLIMQAINPECPATLRDGNVIRDGFHGESDELRGIPEGARGLIAEMEERERACSGIKSLKIGYNQVFGYYIEVTKANLAEVPGDYVRKQTLAGAERFISEELR